MVQCTVGGICVSENSVTRRDINFLSDATKCAAWLYTSSDEKQPVIVMAHGLGSTRDMRLDEYATRFSQAGFACFLFDYRNNGDSDGEQRYRINVKEQLEDWRNAIKFVKTLDNIDCNNIFLFGTSFSGGHVITLSSESDEFRAVIAQCPYTDTVASITAVPIITQMKLFFTLCADFVTRMFGHKIMVKLAYTPNKTALMVDNEYEKYLKLMTQGSKTFKNITPVATVLEFFKYCPGKNAEKVKCPIFYAVCENDTVAPAKKTLYYAKKSKKATIKKYPYGHFDIYLGENFQRVILDYIDYFKKNTYK